MPRNGEETEVAAAVAAADDVASQAQTDGGSASSAEAVETSPVDRVEDAFLEKFGMKEEDEKPEAVEPNADAPSTDEAADAAAPEAQAEEGAAERQKDAGEAKSRLTDEEWKALSPRAQNRLRILTDQAKAAKRERDEAFGQVEEFRGDSEAMTALRTFAAERNLRSEDVTASLNIAGMIQKGDFSGFLQAIGPWYTMAMEATGQALSPEIEKMVSDGDISREAGLRMTKTERSAQLVTERAKVAEAANSQRVEAERTQAQTATFIQSVKDAVTAEEARLRAGDPEWALKAPAIKQQFETMLRHGARPDTPEAAALMLRDIHKGIVLAPKAALRATPAAPDGSSSTRHAAPPKNTLERIERAWDEKFGSRA